MFFKHESLALAATAHSSEYEEVLRQKADCSLQPLTKIFHLEFSRL